MRIGNIIRQTGRLALAVAVVAGVTLAVEKPAQAISGGEAAAIGLGSFAVWQAERAVGDHDRNTVRLRVEPTAKLDRLEPGMTVWLVR